MLGRDADAGVAHAMMRTVLAPRRRAARCGRSARRVLGGVVEQVGDHLRQPHGVGVEPDRLVGQRHPQRVAAPASISGATLCQAPCPARGASRRAARRSSIRPWVMRETSIRSSTSCAMWLSWRSSTSRARSQLRVVAAAPDLEHFERIAHRRQRIAQLVRQGRQEFVLAPVGLCQLRIEGAGVAARQLQMLFVLAAVGGDEHGNLVVLRLAMPAPHGVEQHRYFFALALAHVEQHLGHAALHLHQRAPVGLVKHAPADGQQVRQGFFARPVRAGVAQPAAKRGIGPEDDAIGGAQQQAAGGVLEQGSTSGRKLTVRRRFRDGGHRERHG